MSIFRASHPEPCHKLYFDNYFAHIELLIELKSKNIWAVNTLHSDRMRFCILKKDDRASYDGAVEKNLMKRIV